MMSAAEADMGRIDGLVNNAGIQFVAPIEEFPAEKWDEVIAINLSAAFHTIAVTLPGMKSRGFGRIVNIASVHGVVASAGKVAYTAAKHGLVGLTRTIALEAATDGVTCNAICPVGCGHRLSRPRLRPAWQPRAQAVMKKPVIW